MKKCCFYSVLFSALWLGTLSAGIDEQVEGIGKSLTVVGDELVNLASVLRNTQGVGQGEVKKVGRTGHEELTEDIKRGRVERTREQSVEPGEQPQIISIKPLPAETSEKEDVREPARFEQLSGQPSQPVVEGKSEEPFIPRRLQDAGLLKKNVGDGDEGEVRLSKVQERVKANRERQEKKGMIAQELARDLKDRAKLVQDWVAGGSKIEDSAILDDLGGILEAIKKKEYDISGWVLVLNMAVTQLEQSEKSSEIEGEIEKVLLILAEIKDPITKGEAAPLAAVYQGALSAGFVKLVKRLEDKGRKTQLDKQTVEHHAAYLVDLSDNPEMLNHFLAYHPKYAQHFLFRACQRGAYHLFNICLKYGALPGELLFEAHYRPGQAKLYLPEDALTPLHAACESQEMEKLQKSYYEGVKAGNKDVPNPMQLLVQAFFTGADGKICYVTKDVNQKAPDLWGHKTPVHCACENGFINLVKYLVPENGADIVPGDSTNKPKLSTDDIFWDKSSMGKLANSYGLGVKKADICSVDEKSGLKLPIYYAMKYATDLQSDSGKKNGYELVTYLATMHKKRGLKDGAKDYAKMIRGYVAEFNDYGTELKEAIVTTNGFTEKEFEGN